MKFGAPHQFSLLSIILISQSLTKKVKAHLVDTGYVPEDLYFAYNSLVVFSAFILEQYSAILKT